MIISLLYREDIRSIFRFSFFPETIGTLRSDDADGNENVKKTIGLITKQQLHAFLYISFLFLHDYDAKMPHLAFNGGRKQVTTNFYFSF